MTLTVVIVSWNTKDLLRDCLLSLLAELKQVEQQAFVFVVDNASKDGSAEMVKTEFPSVKLIANKANRGFGAANNQVLTTQNSDYYLLLNPDTKVLPGSIKELISFAQQHPQAGIVSPQLLNADSTVQMSCRRFPSISGMVYGLLGLKSGNKNDYLMRDFDHLSTQEVDQPEGACLLIRKEVFDQVGVFDERFFMLFEEVDLCFRVKQAGWQIWFVPQAKIVHYYGQAIKQVKAKMIYYSHKGFFRYMAKHSRSLWFQLLKPMWFVGLMVLAVLRMLQNSFRRMA